MTSQKPTTKEVTMKQGTIKTALINLLGIFSFGWPFMTGIKNKEVIWKTN